VDDREFLAAFEETTLEPFHHRDHVRVAWLYLAEAPLLEALNRFATNLRRYAAARGADRLYHETITWAFLFLIHERTQRAPRTTFDDFAVANADLFDWSPSLLDRYYRAETLASELARNAFVMPDLRC
jgi:hypothetical protein